MSEPSPPLEVNLEITSKLRLISLTLFTIYATIAISENIPVRLLNPIWQTNAIVTLVDNAFFALIGLLLLELAAWIDRSDSATQKLLQRCSRLAVTAVFGFLLLIPLQIFAAWKSQDLALGNRERTIELTRTRLDALRSRVALARSTSEIEALLKTTQGVQLSQQDRSRPVDDLRQALLSRLDAARRQLPDTRRERSDWQWSALQRSLRLILMTSATAFGFSVLARREPTQSPLLASIRSAIHQTVAGWAQTIETRSERRSSERAFRDEIRRTRELQERRRAQDEQDRAMLAGLEAAESETLSPDANPSDEPDQKPWP